MSGIRCGLPGCGEAIEDKYGRWVHLNGALGHAPEPPGLIQPWNGESTSARLRRVEQEREELVQIVDTLARENERLIQEREELGVALDREHGLLKRAESDRSLLRAELASARAELARLRAATPEATDG